MRRAGEFHGAGVFGFFVFHEAWMWKLRIGYYFNQQQFFRGEWFLKSFAFVFHELTILKGLTIAGEKCLANCKHCHHNLQA